MEQFWGRQKKSRVFGGSVVDREFEMRMDGSHSRSRTLDEEIMPNLGKSDVNEQCFVMVWPSARHLGEGQATICARLAGIEIQRLKNWSAAAKRAFLVSISARSLTSSDSRAEASCCNSSTETAARSCPNTMLRSGFAFGSSQSMGVSMTVGSVAICSGPRGLCGGRRRASCHETSLLPRVWT